jgi:cobalt-precorrin 5A hydrolase
MAGEEAMIALGIGCRRHAPAEDITAVIAQALAAAALGIDDVTVIATEQAKSEQAGIIEAARRLGRPLVGIALSDLAELADLVATRSARVQDIKGVPSVAEAAALAAAGANARLIVPRLANATAACAVAHGEGPRPPSERSS